MPRVSVIIPTYNSARFISSAVSSVLGQSYKDYEIIIVDDGSADATREVTAKFGNKVLYLYQSNAGPAAARNLGLSRATGEFVAYLDADDLWYPQKLEKQVAFLSAHKSYGIVHSDIDVIDENDRVIQPRFNQQTGRTVPAGYCTMQLLHESHVQTLTVMARRVWVDKVGRFDERLKGTEDYLQWILVSMEGAAVGYVDESLAMYRRTNGSISSSSRWMCGEFIKMFEILLKEKDLAFRYGTEAVDIVRYRLLCLGRELAYFERSEGMREIARRRLFSLIKSWPLRVDLYVELLKACVPAGVASKIQTLKVGVWEG